MVFALGGDCPPNAPLPRSRIAAAGGGALLTDRRTAEALHLPHTILATGAALVTQRSAGMSPAVIVTQAAVPVGAPRTSGTVITEMRDPPMTVVQTPAGVIVGAMTR